MFDGILNIKNMTFYAFHGDDIKERELGQRYEVDVELKFDMKNAIKEDNVKFTVNYKKVFKIVERIILGKRFKLIETLASNIADECIKTLKIKKIAVRVRKLKPPVEGILDYVEAEIIKTKR
jgi:dihydroneopterin aldolase